MPCVVKAQSGDMLAWMADHYKLDIVQTNKFLNTFQTQFAGRRDAQAACALSIDGMVDDADKLQMGSEIADLKTAMNRLFPTGMLWNFQPEVDALITTDMSDEQHKKRASEATASISDVVVIGTRVNTTYAGIESFALPSLRIQIAGSRIVVFACPRELATLFDTGDDLAATVTRFSTLDVQSISLDRLPSLRVCTIVCAT